MRVAFFGSLFLLVLLLPGILAFVGRTPLFRRSELRYFSSYPDDAIPIESMRVKEIQEELRQRKVSYKDCFDKENLIKRLVEARANTDLSGNDNTVEVIPEVLERGDYTGLDDETKSFDRQAQLAQLRRMTVPELREECAKQRLDWTKFVHKEDLVQALATAMMEARIEYSVSGFVHPGTVADLTADQLEVELSKPSEAPLLVNIYTRWCKPCRKMAPELQEAAFYLGTRLRIASLDSEKYPVLAKRLGASGLPTNILLNGYDELRRIEGALMKDQILQFVDPFLAGNC
jgi:thiol-disulfide isomerase/thioredoxin